MKHTLTIFVFILLSSCCSTKKAIDNTSKPRTEAIGTNPNENSVELESIKEDSSVVEAPQNTNSEIPESSAPAEVKESVANEVVSIENFNHDSYDQLLQKYVTSKGNVDYKGIRSERSKLSNYIQALGENIPNEKWDDSEKLAYWINAYNAMTIDLILRHYPINSIKDIKDPWKQRYWKLGDKWYNLDEIEHKIIRKMGEPRIHFALVCAAVSCPKLYNKAFTASNLEADLSKLTKEFLADKSKNNISKNDLRLSKIFSWFAKDFKQDGSLIDFLNQYTNVEISSKAKKQFNSYNWDLNE